MTAIKICGITRPEQAAAIAPLVDYLGINLWPRSKRHVSVEAAVALAAAARAAGPARLVGLFVDAEQAEIASAVAAVGFDAIQLHGAEAPEVAAELARTLQLPVWKAVAARPGVAITGWPDAVVLDTPAVERGGTGRTFDWTIARAARAAAPEIPLVLAGGLDPDNVAAAIAVVRPWAVDTASGVERAPGDKDLERVRAFVAAVRGR